MTPRMLLRKDAAAYCSLSEAAFEREVASGKLPFPVRLGGRDHWCVKALDKALDALTGQSDAPDYRKRLYERFGQKAA